MEDKRMMVVLNTEDGQSRWAWPKDICYYVAVKSKFGSGFAYNFMLRDKTAIYGVTQKCKYENDELFDTFMPVWDAKNLQAGERLINLKSLQNYTRCDNPNKKFGQQNRGLSPDLYTLNFSPDVILTDILFERCHSRENVEKLLTKKDPNNDCART